MSHDEPITTLPHPECGCFSQPMSLLPCDRCRVLAPPNTGHTSISVADRRADTCLSPTRRWHSSHLSRGLQQRVVRRLERGKIEKGLGGGRLGTSPQHGRIVAGKVHPWCQFSSGDGHAIGGPAEAQAGARLRHCHVHVPIACPNESRLSPFESHSAISVASRRDWPG